MNAITEHAVLELEPMGARSDVQASPPQGAMLPATTAMLQSAVQAGNIDMVERLMALHERQQANEARAAFIAARAAFKAEKIVVIKDKTNKQYDSKYTTLGNLVSTVTPFLAKHGLSHDWDHTQSPDGKITVTCILSHSMGHSESTSFTVPPDTAGSKNPIQQIKSAITYAKAVTFESITGMAATDANVDDDGNAAGVKGEVVAEVIAQDILSKLLEDVKATKTDAQAAQLWATGSKAIAATKSASAYDQFKKAVVAHRKALKEAEQ